MSGEDSQGYLIIEKVMSWKKDKR